MINNETIREYEQDKYLQNERMRRKMLMKNIEQKAFFNLENIKQTISEISDQRKFLQMQKNDSTPVLNPVFQSVKSQIDKKNAQEVKTFSGKESVKIDTQLFEIPLMEEEVRSYKQFQAMKKNNSDLLQPNKIQKQIQKIEEKLKGKSKTNKFEDISQAEEAPDILKPSSKSQKKKQPKQLSIQSRILRKEKTLMRQDIEQMCNQHKNKLEDQKKEHFITYDLKIKALQQKQMEESQMSRKPSQIFNTNMLLSRNISQKNSPTVRKSTFLLDNIQIPLSNNDKQDHIQPSPLAKKQSSIYFVNDYQTKNQLEKQTSIPNTPLQPSTYGLAKQFSNLIQQQSLSPNRQRSSVLTNQILVSDFAEQLEPTFQKSPLISKINGFQNLKTLKSQQTDRINQIDERQSRSNSIQAMLDSIMEEKQRKQKRQSIIFRNKIKTEGDYEQRSSIATAVTDDGQNIKNYYQSLQFSPIVEDFTSTKVEAHGGHKLQITQKQKQKVEKVELDDSILEQMEKIKIRDTRLNQVKKKLGLIDQVTIKQEQLNQIAKDIEELHKEQQLEKQNAPQAPQTFSRKQEKRNLTFTENESYKLLKLQSRMKNTNIETQGSLEGRRRQRSNQSFNLRANRSTLGTDNYSQREGDEESEVGILSTNRSHNLAPPTQQNTYRSNKKDKDETLSHSSSSQSFSFFRQAKNQQSQRNSSKNNDIPQINFDNYKIQHKLNKNQQNSSKLITHQIQESFHVKRNFLQSSINPLRFEGTQNSGQKSPVERLIDEKNKQYKQNTNMKYNSNPGEEQPLSSREGSVSRMNTLQLTRLKTNQSDRLTNSLSLNLFSGNPQNNIQQQSLQGTKNSMGEQINILGKNSKQLNQNRNRLHSNHMNKRIISNQQQNHHIVQSLSSNHQISSLDNTNPQQLYQGKHNLKSFFKERVELRKDFGEKITQYDRETFACKEKVNNFFDNIIEYSDENKQNSKEIHNLIKKNFQKISSHLQNWKNELQDTNQNFDNYLAYQTINENKNALSLVNLQE